MRQVQVEPGRNSRTGRARRGEAHASAMTAQPQWWCSTARPDWLRPRRRRPLRAEGASRPHSTSPPRCRMAARLSVSDSISIIHHPSSVVRLSRTHGVPSAAMVRAGNKAGAEAFPALRRRQQGGGPATSQRLRGIAMAADQQRRACPGQPARGSSFYFQTATPPPGETPPRQAGGPPSSLARPLAPPPPSKQDRCPSLARRLPFSSPSAPSAPLCL